MVALAALGEATGHRPSELVSWSEVDDWCPQLIFDLQCVAALRVEERIEAERNKHRG